MMVTAEQVCVSTKEGGVSRRVEGKSVKEQRERKKRKLLNVNTTSAALRPASETERHRPNMTALIFRLFCTAVQWS